MQVVADIVVRRQEHPSYKYVSDKHREHYYYRPKNGQKRRNYYFLLCRATVWRYVIFLRICIEYYTQLNRFEMHTAKIIIQIKTYREYLLHSTCIHT